MLKRIVCVCLAMVMLLANFALADTYVSAKKLKPSDDLYCLDRVGVLSEATRGEIVYSNDLLEKACGAQIVVVALGTTGNDAIDDYAYELFNTWGIGSKDDNGFLLLLAVEDEDYYALCGSNLQPKFTSSAIKQYYDRYLEDDFAAGDYDAGVKKFFEAVFERVADTYNAEVTVADGIAAYQAARQSGSAPLTVPTGSGHVNGNTYAEDDGDGMGFVLGLLILVVLFILLIRVRRRWGNNTRVFMNNPGPGAPPPPPNVGQGGYRGVNNMPGAGGYRGPVRTPRRTSSDDAFMRGLMYGLFRSSGSSFRSSGSSFRSSGSSHSSRSSGSSFRSSGGSSSRSFGGGHSSGGGAGRGRH